MGSKDSPRQRELQSAMPPTVLLADNIAPGSLRVRRRPSNSSVFTNMFQHSMAPYILRGFSSPEIITNEALIALNTWRHCINNRNISVDEQRPLWSLQSCLQLVSNLWYINIPNCWNISRTNTVLFYVLLSCIDYFHQESNKLFSTTYKFR